LKYYFAVSPRLENGKKLVEVPDVVLGEDSKVKVKILAYPAPKKVELTKNGVAMDIPLNEKKVRLCEIKKIRIHPHFWCSRANNFFFLQWNSSSHFFFLLSNILAPPFLACSSDECPAEGVNMNFESGAPEELCAKMSSL
jgi:hypothetical protein